MEQLLLMGMNGAEYDWFVSYLANRKQRVVYDGVLSAAQPIMHLWGSAGIRAGPVAVLNLHKFATRMYQVW